MTDPEVKPVETSVFDSGLGKVLGVVLGAIIVGILGQAMAIYTWVKVAEAQLQSMSEDIKEIKADVKDASTDRFRGVDAKESHKALWTAIRDHKHRH